MSDLQQLETLTNLTAQFNRTAEDYCAENPSAHQQILDNLEEGDMDEAVALANKIAAGGLVVMFGDASEEFLLQNIAGCELSCKFAERVLDQDTLKSFLPEDLKTAESVAQLEAAGAPKLAALCKAAL